jgi:integrase
MSSPIRYLPARPVQANATGETMISEYKRYVRNETRSEATIRARDHYINHLTADLNVETATETDLETWLRSKNWSPSSMNSALGSVRHFYRWAQRYGHIPTNPTLGLRRAPMPRTRARIAPDKTIIQAMMRAPIDTRIMIMLGAECGLRRSEIAKTHINDIDGTWLHITGKGGHERTVHLSPELQELITALNPTGWLFPHNGTHLSGDAVYRRIKRIANVNAHSLRHRAGTAVYHGTGNNLRVAQEFLGHASPAMTARYVHITRQDLERAAEAARIAPLAA